MSSTHIQDQLPSFDAASSGRVVLKRFGQTVEGFELLVILLVLHLKGVRGLVLSLKDQFEENGRVVITWNDINGIQS